MCFPDNTATLLKVILEIYRGKSLLLLFFTALECLIRKVKSLFVNDYHGYPLPF